MQQHERIAVTSELEDEEKAEEARAVYIDTSLLSHQSAKELRKPNFGSLLVYECT